MKKALLVCLSTMVIALPCSFRTAKADPPPGLIKLLPGYKHETGAGIDTIIGRIWKSDGITIEYDIGHWAGEYASPKHIDEYTWYREQSLDGIPVRLALTKERKLIATFPNPDAPSNFLALVRTEQDLVDALLMILTYKHS